MGDGYVLVQSGVQKEFFLLNEEGKLDLSEVSLLFGSPLYEADEKGKIIGLLECDAAEITRKTFTPGSTVNVIPNATLVHGSHSCSNCDMQPISGVRYECSECVYSFNLCLDCFSQHENVHEGTSGIHKHKAKKFSKLEKVIYANFWLSGDSLVRTLLNTFNNYGPLTCVGYEESNLEFKWLSYSEMKSRFINFSNGLSSILKPRSHVGIYATNKVEWLIADLACVYSAFVSVYMHHPMDTDSLVFLIKDANLAAIICETSLQILEIATKTPSLKLIVQINSVSENEYKLAAAANIQIISFNELEKLGLNEIKPPTRVNDKDLSTISYTSGSTGHPKGVMFTFGSMNEYLKGTITVVEGEKTVLMEYLPLSHTRGVFRHCCLLGGTYVLCNRGLEDVFEIARVVNPTRFRGVPVVWNKLYSEYQTALKLATSDGTSQEEAVKSVRAKFQGILGNRLIRVSTGSAPTSPAVKQFLAECFNAIVDAYGCTEAGSISANNRIVSGSDVKIVDCEELGYTKEDKPYPRGEVAVRTLSMSSGYYNNSEATSAAFTDDGYFLTGDIVEMRGEELVLIDRKKNFFKLSNGKFVRCEHLENLFSKSEHIHQMFISGDPMQDYVVAIVVPKKGFLPEDGDELRKIIINDIIKIALEHKIPHYETPKGIILESKPFSIEDGTLTINYKKARVALQAKYKQQLYNLYSTPQSSVDVTIDYLKGIADNTFGLQSENSDYFSTASDSVSKVLLVSQLKNHFDKEIPLSVAFQSMTVEDVAKLVLSPNQEDTEEKLFLQDLALPLPKLDGVKPCKSFDIFDTSDSENSKKRLFLTGATGFVGAFILAQLLRRTALRIACLVRPASAGGAEDAGNRSNLRILRALRRFRVDVDERLVLERVEEVEGELGQERMGMGEGVWSRMITEVDAIVHCAASVNWILPYSQQRLANVKGTMSILELATSVKVKPLCFVSTLSVTRNVNNTGLSLPEEFMTTPAFNRRDGYIMSKWMGEHLVRKMSLSGLPVVIIRPGMVTGHSKNGGLPESQFMSRVLRGIDYMKSSPVLSTVITDLTPVDFVAIASSHILHNLLREGNTTLETKCLPLWNDKYTSFLDVAKCFRAHGREIEDITYDNWIARIKSSDPKSNPLFALVQFLPHGDGPTSGPPNLHLPLIHDLCKGETIPVLELSTPTLLSSMLQFVLQND